MTALSLQSVQAAPETAGPEHTKKVVRAAQDFESVLLGEMLQSLEKNLSAVPGESSAAGADDFHYLGTQALASALAERGGLGIARMIVRNLLKSGQGTPATELPVRLFGG